MTIPTFNTTTHIPVMEQFYTIQGEGFHAGKAAYFIRLAGCDVGCVWCDVKESWTVAEQQIVTIESIVNNALQYPARLAVITGGEPLMYNCEALTKALQKSGFQTNIETSGAYTLSGNWNWFCLSPKKFMKPKEEVCQFANELKIIIYNKSDFAWAEEYAEKVSNTCILLLQPEWSVADKMMPLIVDYVKANPQWRVSLQTHKFMNVP
jgi:organic radical activating enzyme